MTLIPCRDCGTMIDPKGRGCNTCALNLNAERMVDRVVLCAIVLALVAAAAIFILFYLRH